MQEENIVRAHSQVSKGLLLYLSQLLYTQGAKLQICSFLEALWAQECSFSAPAGAGTFACPGAIGHRAALHPWPGVGTHRTRFPTDPSASKTFKNRSWSVFAAVQSGCAAKDTNSSFSHLFAPPYRRQQHRPQSPAAPLKRHNRSTSGVVYSSL